MMKNTQFITAVTTVGMLALASSTQAQPVSLTMASGLPAEHTSTKAMDVLKAEVSRRSHGSIEIELAPGEQLGSASELVQKLRAESIFATWTGVSYFARHVPEIEAANLPFVFRSYDDVMRIIDGPVGRLIEAKVDAKGFVLLAWMELGARNVANAKRPLKTLDDFKASLCAKEAASPSPDRAGPVAPVAVRCHCCGNSTTALAIGVHSVGDLLPFSASEPYGALSGMTGAPRRMRLGSLSQRLPGAPVPTQPREAEGALDHNHVDAAVRGIGKAAHWRSGVISGGVCAAAGRFCDLEFADWNPRRLALVDDWVTQHCIRRHCRQAPAAYKGE